MYFISQFSIIVYMNLWCYKTFQLFALKHCVSVAVVHVMIKEMLNKKCNTLRIFCVLFLMQTNIFSFYFLYSLTYPIFYAIMSWLIHMESYCLNWRLTYFRYNIEIPRFLNGLLEDYEISTFLLAQVQLLGKGVLALPEHMVLFPCFVEARLIWDFCCLCFLFVSASSL